MAISDAIELAKERAAANAAAEGQTMPEVDNSVPNYDDHYTNDPRLTEISTNKDKTLTELGETYNGAINGVDKFYDDLKTANQEWADKQAQIQQDQTDFAIEKIEQQKEQAQKDYLKEQSGAYVDYKKQSNAYGVNAEKLAGAGLTDSGYAESSQVSMYNTYQNRVATARETLAQAKLTYDNGIKEAMLANNAALAEIYANAYLKQAELALEGFQYKNDLVLELANKKVEVDSIYHNQYMDVLQQINNEVALKEDIRQYNETMKWNTEQAQLDRQHDERLKELQHDYDKKLAEIEQNYKLAYLDASTAKEKEILKVQHDNDIAKLKQQLENEKALLKYEYDLEHQSVGKVGGTTTTTGNKLGTTKATTYKDYRQTQVAQNNAFSGTTYESAVSYLKSKGISASGIMTANEWSRRKASYNSTGIGGAEVKNYSSYSAYLKAYVSYKTGNK